MGQVPIPTDAVLTLHKHTYSLITVSTVPWYTMLPACAWYKLRVHNPPPKSQHPFQGCSTASMQLAVACKKDRTKDDDCDERVMRAARRYAETVIDIASCTKLCLQAVCRCVLGNLGNAQVGSRRPPTLVEVSRCTTLWFPL